MADFSDKFVKQETCWICGGREFRFQHAARFDTNFSNDAEFRAYSGLTVDFHACDACGFTQPAGLPSYPNYFDCLYANAWSEEWIEQEFNANYKDGIFNTVLTRLERLLPKTSRSLLDVGTHVGRMLVHAKTRGWNASGIELHPRIAEFANARSGCPVHRMNANQLAATGERYDAVVLTDVLEHIPHPGEILKDMYSLVKAGGAVAVKVPYGRHQLFKERLRSKLKPGYPIHVASCLVHVNHFSANSLKMALTNAGFENVEIRVGAPEIDWSMKPKAVLSRWFRFGVYRLASLPGGLSTPLALNLQVYGRKPA